MLIFKCGYDDVNISLGDTVMLKFEWGYNGVFNGGTLMLISKWGNDNVNISVRVR